MKEIQLTQGKVALVDDDDFEWLSQWKWHAQRSYSGVFYAKGPAGEFVPRRGRKLEAMHRLILNLRPDDPRWSDHKDGNGLNNQRFNLRAVEPAKNRWNCHRFKKTESGFIGVYPNISRTGKRTSWKAQIITNWKPIVLGPFPSPIEAARAYDKLAIEVRGEFAILNGV